MQNHVLEHLTKSMKVLLILVLGCILMLISRNSLALDTENPVPTATSVTADQQAMNSTDMEITRKIRQEIMADKAMSIRAQNVKIISRDGRVTLKGMVASPQEKTRIGEIAENVVGVANVTNDTTITK